MRFILGVIFGVAAGAVVGIVMAPQSGRETREALQRRVNHGTEDGQEAIEAGAIRRSVD